ncbi:Origin recognition complex subunit 5 [Nowakowskiella sp. JEL0078]|nr:Origin recognition complex subunit 5 [Nowakowskiella sp. JEL0078]
MIQIVLEDFPEEEDRDLFRSFVSLLYDTFRAPSQYLDELRYHATLFFPKYIEPIKQGKATKQQVGKLAKNVEIYLREAIDKMYMREISEVDLKNIEKMHIDSNNPTYIKKIVQYDLELPFFTKYLLIAAYLASYNPKKLDSRYFSRIGEGKRRKGKEPIQKIRQQLLGPKSFTIERMLAIFYSIIDRSMEHSIDIESQIASLVSLKLLTKISRSDQLDGLKCKCNASFGLIHEIAEGIKFDLRNFLHDV